MGLIKSFTHATNGILHILKSESNARIHLLMSIVVLLLGLWLGVSNVALAAIFFAVVLVFLAEIVNTAFEKTLDIIDSNHRPEIKIIKDMAAGAVLVSAIAAASIGVVIFGPLLIKLLWPAQ